MKSILGSQEPEREMDSATQELERAIKDYVDKSMRDAQSQDMQSVEIPAKSTETHSSGGSGGSRLPMLLVVGIAAGVAYLLRQQSGSMQETVQSASTRLEDVTGQTADRTEEMSHEAAERVRESGQQVGDRTEEMSHEAADRLEEGGQQAGDRVEETGEAASDKMEEAEEKADEMDEDDEDWTE